MASTARRGPKRPLAAQLGALKTKYPAGKVYFKRGVVTWVGPLQPSPVSRTYTVKVAYHTGWTRPRVTVIDPPLRQPDDPRLPHVFPGDRLCLHYTEEWHDGLAIADTILPWAAEYLLHYEYWQATGQWHGGGHEPPPTESGE